MGFRERDEWDKEYGYPIELQEGDDPSLCSGLHDVETEELKSHNEYGSWWKEIRVGDTVDALLTGVKEWVPADVLDVFPDYIGKVCARSGSGIDIFETFPLWDARRIAPSGTCVEVGSVPMKRPRSGDSFQVLDKRRGKWFRAIILAEDIPGNLVLVHFECSESEDEGDEWMDWKELCALSYVKPVQILHGVHHQPPSSAEKRPLASLHHIPSSHRRAISAASDNYNRYISALRRKGLKVHPVEGDGNCLFRSVSHQIYGTDDLHGLVRQSCMEYMESEANYFEPYVEGGMSEFLEYVHAKCKEGVWGDDPELQAMCEMYNRTAEVWSYDAVEGAKQLRMYHEASTKRELDEIKEQPEGLGGTETGTNMRGRGYWMPTMRLSYYGGGHYDSLLPVEEELSEPQEVHYPQPGLLEQEALSLSRQRNGASSSCQPEATTGLSYFSNVGQDGDEVKELVVSSSSNEDALNMALKKSREDYESQHPDLEEALAVSLHELDAASVTKDSELAALQEEIFNVAKKQSADDQLATALQASTKEFSCSSSSSPIFAAEKEDTEVLEQELLAAVLAESMGDEQDISLIESSKAIQQALTLAEYGNHDNMTPIDEEEDELQKALLMSQLDQ